MFNIFYYIYDDFVLIHEDLWYENYIVSSDGKCLNGIIDFEDSFVFMREYDFVPLLYVGDDFMNIVSENYKYTLNLDLLIMLLVRRELCSFEYICQDKIEDIDEQIEKINDSLSNFF